jgi:phosphoribosyl-ATP pyrophosphohydrolase
MSDTAILSELWDVINDRMEHPVPGSYVNRLMNDDKGIDRVLEKIGEESTEFIIAVKNGMHGRTVEEAADLQFHLLLAIRAAGVDLSEVMRELASRRR